MDDKKSETQHQEQRKPQADVPSAHRLQSSFPSPITSQAPLAHALIELADFRKVITDSIFHPIEAFNTYLPHLNPFKMFGAKSFNPETDIPDLSGKIILVTGGMYVQRLISITLSSPVTNSTCQETPDWAKRPSFNWQSTTLHESTWPHAPPPRPNPPSLTSGPLSPKRLSLSCLSTSLPSLRYSLLQKRSNRNQIASIS
jgi:hypothetical protein